MRIRKGDQVKILSGKDRGKTGKVTRVDSKEGKAIVDGLNLIKRHTRPKKQGEKGQRITIAAPVSLSSLMLVCPKCSKPARVGVKKSGEKKFRICKKCKSEL